MKTATGRQAGLLVAWVRGADTAWWGKIAIADQPGEASLQLIHGRFLTPASTDPNETDSNSTPRPRT